MKKLIVVTLVIVMVLGISTTALANPGQNPNQRPGAAAESTPCGFRAELWEGGSNIRIYIYFDGEYGVIDGDDLDDNGTFTQRVLHNGADVVLVIRGNSLLAINCSCDDCDKAAPPPKRDPVWDEWNGKVSRTIAGSNIGVNLYQVNRNHWARTLPTLHIDDPVAFNILMARNGNVNLAEVGGTVTIEVITERWGAYFVADENGKPTKVRVCETPTRLAPLIESEVINFSEASRRFFPYDAGTTIFPINVSHEDISLNFVLSVRGNTTLLPASSLTVSAHGDTSTAGVSGQWFRVMSGHQGTH